MRSATTLFQKTICLCLILSAHSFISRAQDALFISPTGQVTVDNSLTVKSDFAANGNVTISKELTVQEGLTSRSKITANNGMNVTGGDVTIANALTARAITTTGTITTNTDLYVTGTATTVKLTTGSMLITNGVIQSGGVAKMSTTDLGLYSNSQYGMIRLVTNKGDIAFYTSTSTSGGGTIPDMVITNEGNVGIGVVSSDVKAKLEVNGTKSYKIKGGYQFLNRTDVGKYGDDISVGVSILGSGRIVTNAEFNVYSDARIKKDLVRSDAVKDLSALNRIQITDYRYIDAIAHGNGYKKGVIAQELKQVFPEAVNTGEEFVPNIFSKPVKIIAGNGIVGFTMPRPHQLVNGDMVRIMTAGGAEEKKVSVTGKNSFTIEDDAARYTDAFIFGKKVTDFLMVDHDRLSMLNISATQQLSKEIDALKKQNEALQEEIALLKQKDADSRSAMASIQSRLQAIENMQANTGR